MSLKPDPLSYPPRGLSREEAARYVGISPTKFMQLVAAQRMPRPRRIDGRNVWDRISLDIAFTQMPGGDDDEPQSETDRILKKALTGKRS